MADVARVFRILKIVYIIPNITAAQAVDREFNRQSNSIGNSIGNTTGNSIGNPIGNSIGNKKYVQKTNPENT